MTKTLVATPDPDPNDPNDHWVAVEYSVLKELLQRAKKCGRWDLVTPEEDMELERKAIMALSGIMPFTLAWDQQTISSGHLGFSNSSFQLNVTVRPRG
jgi:hypothetical protein